MIISDEYKFAFIHIPKCAGSTARDVLADYDSRNNYYWLTKEVSDRGTYHFAHLTPALMADVCPDELQRIGQYRKFGLIRDPSRRFLSSFKQNVEENTGKKLPDLSPDDVCAELDRVIQALSRDVEMNPHYVHFTRQVEFVYYHGERFIHHVYRVEEVNWFYADIERLVGRPLHPQSSAKGNDRKNVSRVYRNDFMRRTLNGIRPVAAKCLPMTAKNALRPLFFVSPAKRRFEAFESDYVKDFVKSYYEADIKLYNSLSEDLATSTG